VSEYAIYPWTSSAMEVDTETKFGTKVAWGRGWCQNVEYTRDNEKYNVRNIRAQCIDRTCVVLMALCNQPRAFTLDDSDDQSRYL